MKYFFEIFVFLIFVTACIYAIMNNTNLKNSTYPQLKRNGFPSLDPNISSPGFFLNTEKVEADIKEKNAYECFLLLLKKDELVKPNLAIKYLGKYAKKYKYVDKPDFRENDLRPSERFINIEYSKEYDDLIYRIKNNKQYSNKEILRFLE